MKYYISFFTVWTGFSQPLKLIEVEYFFFLNKLKLNTYFFFFLSGSLVARIHLIRWIRGVSGVRTPALAYNNVLSYQLSYAHGTSWIHISIIWNKICFAITTFIKLKKYFYFLKTLTKFKLLYILYLHNII